MKNGPNSAILSLGESGISKTDDEMRAQYGARLTADLVPLGARLGVGAIVIKSWLGLVCAVTVAWASDDVPYATVAAALETLPYVRGVTPNTDLFPTGDS